MRTYTVILMLALPTGAFGDLVTGSVTFSTLGEPATQYGIVNWSSTTAGSFSQTGFSENYNITSTDAQSGYSALGGSSFNRTFHGSGLDSQDLSLTGAGYNEINAGGGTAGSPFSVSWTGGSVSSALLYIGVGNGSNQANHIRVGSFTIGAGFEFAIVAGKNSNFDVGDGTVFDHTLGTIGNVLAPQAGSGSQTAGVLLVRRTDGGVFSSFGLTPQGSGSGDRVQMQLGLPVTATPEPNSLVLTLVLAPAFVRRRRRRPSDL